jgi:hypothetical protein
MMIVSVSKKKAKARKLRALEGDLGTLELGDAALGLVVATLATETTATTAAATEATTTSTTSTATETTAAATAAATEATTTTLTRRTGSAEVQTERTALNVNTLELGVSGTSLLDGGELDVTEALGAAIVRVGGQTDTKDGTLLTEDVTESILGGAEGQVANEESVALGAGRVTKALGTGLSTLAATLLLVVLAANGVVQVDGTAIELGTLLGLEGLGGIGSVGVLDVTEAMKEMRISDLIQNHAQCERRICENLPTRATRFTVSDDTAASELTELGELALEPILINVPGQVANEQVRGSTLGGILGLGLLGSSDGLLLGLALLGGLLLSLGLRVGAVGAVRAGLGLRIGRGLL